MDKAYDSEKLHRWLRENGIFSVAPVKKNWAKGQIRKQLKDCFDYSLYWQRNIVESLFSVAQLVLSRLSGVQLVLFLLSGDQLAEPMLSGAQLSEPILSGVQLVLGGKSILRVDSTSIKVMDSD